jgi:hypothetical protein
MQNFIRHKKSRDALWANRLSQSEDRNFLRLHRAGHLQQCMSVLLRKYYMQSDRQQQFTWSQEESPVWKQGLLPSATWIDLTRSVFFIFPHGIPIFFATSFTSFIFITAPPIKVIIFSK